MGFAPTWLRQVSPLPLLHKTTLTTVSVRLVGPTSRMKRLHVPIVGPTGRPDPGYVRLVGQTSRTVADPPTSANQINVACKLISHHSCI